MDMGLDETAVEAWLAERGGEVREVKVRSSRGLQPGRVVSPPPRTTAVVYIVPDSAFAASLHASSAHPLEYDERGFPISQRPPGPTQTSP